MAWNNAYSWPPVFINIQPQTENIVFDLQLVEFTDMKPGDTKG